MLRICGFVDVKLTYRSANIFQKPISELFMLLECAIKRGLNAEHCVMEKKNSHHIADFGIQKRFWEDS